MPTPSTLTTVDAVTAARSTLAAEAQGILDRAGDAALEGDTLTRFDAITAELDQLATRQAQLETIARHAARPGGLEHTTPPATTRAADPYDMNDRDYYGGGIQSRALAAIEATRHLDDGYKEAATRLLERHDTADGRLARHVIVTGRPEYRTGWLKLATGQQWALTTEEQAAVVEARAASLTDAAGGYAVPLTLDPSLILTNAGTSNPWRQIARVITLTGSDEWRGVTTAGITASWDPEFTEVSDDAPTLAPVTIKPEKAQAFVPFSVEVGGDWVGMEAELREAFADAKDRLEAAAFTTGSGTGGVPMGIITALVADGTSIVATATGDTLAAADLYALQAATPPRFRSNGVWVANLSILNRVRQFTDAVGGFRNSLDLSTELGPSILGRPVYESSDMDGTIDAAAANYIVLFGDVRAAFTIVDRVGLSVELVPHLLGTNRRPNGSRGLYAWWRVGSGLVNPAAVRLLNA